MQPINDNGNLLEIIDLAHSLRQEHLFIANEQASFNRLNETLSRNSSSVAQLAWICSQQRQNLNSLIISRPDTGPTECCHKANTLENTRFVEAHKAKTVKYEHVLAYNQLFNFLHHSPYLMAQSLSVGDRLEQISNDQMNSVVRTIATGLYGNAILSKDVDMVLRLLRDLIEIQVIVSENPRRMLRSGSCSFSRLYSRLHESLFSAKLFLTAALHEPVMKVLIGDDFVLDIDANKAVLNFPPKEREKKFGIEGTDEYAEKFKEFHRETLASLFELSKLFIKSLSNNWAMFPSTLRWVVQTMCHLLKSVHVNDKDINDILTAMIFTNFICPAVVSPDLYGISDAPISENARLNLIQIGQILQMFALMRHDGIDPKYAELFAMFDRNTVSDLMEQLLETENDIRVSSMAIPHQNDFGRSHVLVTQHELNVFVDFLRTVLDNDELSISGEDRRNLGKILEQLPSKFETAVNGDHQHINLANGGPATVFESQSKTKQLINLGKSTKNKLAKSISLNVGGNSNNNNNNETEEFGGGATVNYNGSIGLNNNVYHGEDHENVLMIPISISEENKFQLLTEQEVLNMNNISNEIEPVLTEQNVNTLDKTTNAAFDDELGAVMPTRKHTRFSLSQDDQSIGNSDNLEVVSEAPSNHSVTSSLELEENDQNLNDNLSDMVSANVSGRGTPNISGRDTPSSQVTEGENAQIPTPQMAKILNKARSDIDDKFCKFEIKKLVEGDETISIISDTWSTDVLASDSETLEPVENERNFSTPLIPSAVVLPGDNNFNPLSNPVSQLRANFLDASDTRSESAWSTDVLASDSEKMTEIDTDDNQSIAAKSDTTDANRSEGDPIPDLIPVNQRAPDSPFFSPRNRAPDSPMFAPRAPDSPLFSGGTRGSTVAQFDDRRLGTQSPRFPNEDYARCASVSSPSAMAGGRNASANRRYNETPYRSYRSTNGDSFGERDTFLGAGNSTMHRQNSAESSISNQSSTLDDAVALNKSKKSTENKSNFSMNDFLRENTQHRTEETVVKTSTDIINPFADDDLGAQGTSTGVLRHGESNHNAPYSEEHVERRRMSAEQRNASFDGRRNGISFSNVSTGSNSITATTVKRFAKSLNYENHEIIAKTKTASMQLMSSSATDDDKNKQQDEYLLVQKTISMSLKDTTNGFSQSPIENSAEVFAAGASAAATVAAVAVGVDATTAVGADDSMNKANGTKYTGAIPKSISFDASADKSGMGRKYESPNTSPFHQHVQTNGRHNGNGFFSKIKKGFRRNPKLPRATFEDYTALPIPIENGGGNVAVGNSMFVGSSQKSSLENGFNDTEDILEKYRRKISSSSEATNSDSIGNNSNERKSLMNTDEHRLSGLLLDESIYLYTKTKQKLRLVLSTTDLHTADFRHTNCNKTPPLLVYLHIQLAQAQNLQNLQQISYVSEVIRSVNQLDESQQQTLIADLQTDLVKRESYLQYLMRYHQNLLSALENIDRFEDRLRNDREMCNRHLIMVCVRLFLKKCDAVIEQFEDQFAALTVFDEKIDIMLEFMGRLMDDLKSDGILQGMADWQLHEARTCIERILLQRLYRRVMFPNDDADISRDEVLREHIRKLSTVITPSHSALRIPKAFWIEAPWPFAQQQISYISAYKTPREKVQCVVRCITSIMNLLSMSSNRIPSADDLIPVLIYVVIMANPPYLLSTIQYVNAFIGDEIEGEDQYWWTQFCSAVTFIKTMDYRD